MKKTILIILVLVMVICSAFADVRFSGGAKVVWGFDFNTEAFYASGRDKTPVSSSTTTPAAANLRFRVTGDWFYFDFMGAIYSRSNDSEGINARATLKGKPLLKEAGIEINNLDQLDILIGNQIIRSNKVYADPLAHDDGSVQLLLATNFRYLPAGVEFGTKDWTVKIGGTVVTGHQEIGGNIRLRLFDGALWAEAGYAYNSDEKFDSPLRCGHKYDDGGNGHRVGASASVDVAKFFGMENLGIILSGDVQLNLSDGTDLYGNKNANAYYAAFVLKTDRFFLGAEYRDIPKTIEKVEDVTERILTRIKAVEGKASYTFIDNNLKPTLEASAGYMLSRKNLSGQPENNDNGFMCSAAGSITVLGLTVKLGYTYQKFEPGKVTGASRAYFELNFKF